jgi:hypothetical protein
LSLAQAPDVGRLKAPFFIWREALSAFQAGAGSPPGKGSPPTANPKCIAIPTAPLHPGGTTARVVVPFKPVAHAHGQGLPGSSPGSGVVYARLSQNREIGIGVLPGGEEGFEAGARGS